MLPSRLTIRRGIAVTVAPHSVVDSRFTVARSLLRWGSLHRVLSQSRIDDPPIVVPSPPTVAPSPPTVVPSPPTIASSPTAPYPPIAPSPPIESSPPIATSPHSSVHSNPQHDNEEPQIDNEQPSHLYGRSWGKDPTDGKTWIYPDKKT
ncbi:uncharacterized protein G2W53_033252 [Senna tora]|uniref:Uncharacterized protein n=1 Tax=Senna tora TaxID=362788 RepID=A0A834SYX4_9FABA|nr:uncharacterized protein G2W53_033252 [Senna tora]